MRAHLYALFVLFAATCLAFEPPVYTAGPLTVRIEQPTLGSYGARARVRFDQPDAPSILNVQLSNSADQPWQGALRACVTGRRRVKPPTVTIAN